MITNTGTQILGKFLVGQAPAYASYIAVGCGLNPTSNVTTDDYSDKTSLDFEMFRIPITSRSYINEGGENKIIFSADLPTQERYHITEAAVYSAGSNPTAGTSDSKMIYTFTTTENWENHIGSQTSTVTYPETTPIVDSSTGDFDSSLLVANASAFIVSTTNAMFDNTARPGYLEQPRFQEDSIVIPGNFSSITTGSGLWSVTGNHIHLTGQSFNLDNNSQSDELVLSFSIFKANAAANVANITSANLLIEFSSNEAETAIETDGGPYVGQYAQFQVELGAAQIAGNDDYFYFVERKAIGDLKKTDLFSWSTVKAVKVFVDIESSDSQEYLVALDGIRLDNVFDTSSNPLYGMTAYSPVYDSGYVPVLKETNSKNILSLNFDIGVV